MIAAAVMASATPAAAAAADDSYNGSDMWLRYEPVSDSQRRHEYRRLVNTIVVENASRNKVHRHTEALQMEPGSREQLVRTSLEAARNELVRGARGLLDRRVPVKGKPGDRLPDGAVVVGTRDSSKAVRQHVSARALASAGNEGYVIRSLRSGRQGFTVIAGNTEVGALHGTFAFLRLMQTQRSIRNLDVSEAPRIRNRHLNNWEATRLYAGNDATGTGGLNGENGTIFNFAATGPSAGRNLPVILDRYIVA
ncbi:MAG TPA: alpha-glucuronidase family glycosyl hydrolase, partial [Solirubrobacteraceae bacterium]|nr:alpha-glucuronidase family glycosyl hydrolase [Solirubrobacteraceae bacterium]